MARCGCNSICNCAVIPCEDTSGLPVEIKGNGQPGTPYQICVSPPAIQVTDSNTVDLAISGTGSQADPYDITAGVIINPAPANGLPELLREEAGGLTLTCEDVQTCGPFPTTAGPCGIQGTGTLADPLVAKVAAWPFACDQSANAQGVFCDPNSGQLQSPPRTGFVGYAAATQTQSFPAPGAGIATTETLTMTIGAALANPTCYNMATQRSIRGHYTFMGVGHAQGQIVPNIGAFPAPGTADLFFDYHPATNNAAFELGVQSLVVVPGATVGPGGVANESAGIAANRVAGQGAVGITFQQVTLELYGWTTI